MRSFNFADVSLNKVSKIEMLVAEVKTSIGPFY